MDLENIVIIVVFNRNETISPLKLNFIENMKQLRLYKYLNVPTNI